MCYNISKQHKITFKGFLEKHHNEKSGRTIKGSHQYDLKYKNSITLFSHVDRFHDLGICQLYCGPLEQSQVIHLVFIHSRWTWKFGWSYTLGTMCKIYSLFKEYLQNTMFTPILFLENTIHSNTSIENNDTTHNSLTIQTSTIHYSYQHQFLPIS